MLFTHTSFYSRYSVLCVCLCVYLCVDNDMAWSAALSAGIIVQCFTFFTVPAVGTEQTLLGSCVWTAPVEAVFGLLPL